MREVQPERHETLSQPNWMDRSIGWVAPQWGLRRQRARVQMSHLSAVQTRLDRGWPRRTHTDKGRLKTFPELADQQDRAADLIDNNAIAEGLVTRCVDNVVGTGMTVQAKTADAGWNTAAETLVKTWFNEEADVTRVAGACETQEMFLRSHLGLGDAIIILLASGELQMIDPGLLQTPWDKAGSKDIVDGVQKDAAGKPVRYWFATEPQPGQIKYESVDARNVVHWPRRLATNATRGCGVFHNTAPYFDKIDANIEAVIAASQMAAMLGLVIKSKDPAQVGRLGTTPNAAGGNSPAFQMEPGMVQYLEDGEDVFQVNPTQPSTQWPDFLSVIMRIIGLPVGLPLELMFLDFSKTNYSSARAALLQAYRAFMRIQAGLIRHLSRIYRWRISKFIKAGLLSPREDAWVHEWTPMGWPWVDPVKEVVGNLIAVDAGFSTIRDVIAGQGKDWEDTFKQRKLELSRMAEAGMPRMHSTSTKSLDAELASARKSAAGGDGSDRPDEPGDESMSDD